jgi:hypothetical protein
MRFDFPQQSGGATHDHHHRRSPNTAVPQSAAATRGAPVRVDAVEANGGQVESLEMVL